MKAYIKHIVYTSMYHTKLLMCMLYCTASVSLLYLFYICSLNTNN